MPKITFEYCSEFANVTDNAPAPATKFLPKWLKDFARYPAGKIRADGSGGVAQTIKACPPFLDSMMLGYVIATEFDMIVTLVDGVHYFSYKAGGDLVTQHFKYQIDKSQIPDGYSDQPWKFTNFYRIRTPKGYSTLFMHPINREDLPFKTLSGTVETDEFSLMVNFPFFIKQDFEGIIPAGTPIVQLIPLKREKWVMALAKIKDELLRKASIRFNHKIISSYKSTFWRRKEYR